MAKLVDTSEVFKQLVHCPRCDEAFYFTLRGIAEDEKLNCPVCATGINLSDDDYKSLVASVRDTIRSLAA
jgi:C4-type Zn-finger protein